MNCILPTHKDAASNLGRFRTLGERNGVYVHAYVTEGRVYFILGEE
jgi:hypothetical protein